MLASFHFQMFWANEIETMDETQSDEMKTKLHEWIPTIFYEQDK